MWRLMIHCIEGQSEFCCNYNMRREIATFDTFLVIAVTAETCVMCGSWLQANYIWCAFGKLSLASRSLARKALIQHNFFYFTPCSYSLDIQKLHHLNPFHNHTQFVYKNFSFFYFTSCWLHNFSLFSVSGLLTHRQELYVKVLQLLLQVTRITKQQTNKTVH